MHLGSEQCFGPSSAYNAGFFYEKINFIHTAYCKPAVVCVYIFFCISPPLWFLPLIPYINTHMRFPFPYNAYIRTYTYILLPVTRTDCRAPELMKCQAQTPLHPSSQLPRPPTVRTKIIITVSRALSHFICSTSVQYILYRYRYIICIWYIRITYTHMHAFLKYIQFCIGIYNCRYVYLHICMWTKCDIAIVATQRPNFINISH